MAIVLTEKAAFRLRGFLQGSAKNNAEKGIRVAVLDGGCGGYEYSLDVATKRNPDDLVFEQDKVRLYVDPQSALLLDGVVIDFFESLTQSGFKFVNPNASSTCGCGKSFSVGECPPPGVPCS